MQMSDIGAIAGGLVRKPHLPSVMSHVQSVRQLSERPEVHEGQKRRPHLRAVRLAARSQVQ